MGINENAVGLNAAAGAPVSKGFALNPLHEAALRLAASHFGRRREKSRDLVAALLSHGARAWRHSQPRANIHLHIGIRSGRVPLRLHLG